MYKKLFREYISYSEDYTEIIISFFKEEYFYKIIIDIIRNCILLLSYIPKIVMMERLEIFLSIKNLVNKVFYVCFSLKMYMKIN